MLLLYICELLRGSVADELSTSGLEKTARVVSDPKPAKPLEIKKYHVMNLRD